MKAIKCLSLCYFMACIFMACGGGKKTADVGEVNNFDKEEYLVGIDDVNRLSEALKRIKTFTPKKG